MIEIIKTLVEALTNGFPGLREMRQDKRRRKLGAELFFIYTELNEVTITAERIIKALEEFATDTISDLEGGGVDSFFPSHLRHLVRMQHDGLREVRKHIGRNSIVVQVIEPDAYNRLMPLLGAKQGALAILIGLLDRGVLPLDPSRAEVDRWSDSMAASSLRSRNVPPRHRTAIDGTVADQITAGAWHDWQQSALSVGPWGLEAQSRVIHYLDERHPRERLNEIQSALSLLRSSLLEHFTIADVLLEIGERRTGR